MYYTEQKDCLLFYWYNYILFEVVLTNKSKGSSFIIALIGTLILYTAFMLATELRCPIYTLYYSTSILVCNQVFVTKYFIN